MAKYIVTYKDFSGGLTEVAPDIMNNNELIVAQNVVPDERGGLSKAKGTTRVNAAAYDANGVDVLIEFGRTDGTVIDLVFSNTTMRKWDGTVIKSDLPAPPTDWDVYNDKLYWLDGTKFWQYDGTTVAEVTMNAGGDATVWAIIKTCHYIEQRGQRHFFAKNNTNDLYYSELGDPAHIKAANIIKSVTDDSDKIRGLKEYGGALLVFKKEAIFGWFGYNPTTDVEFKRVLAHKGTVSNKTICRVEDMLVYMADDGVYALRNLYTDIISSINISERKIGNTIKGAIYKELACAIYYQGVYHLSICTSGTVNNAEYRMYMFTNSDDALTVSWYGAFTHPIACYLYKPEDGKLYSGHPSNGLIFEHNSGYNYDGSAIPVIATTKPFDIAEKLIVETVVKRFFVAARQYAVPRSSASVTIKIDYFEVTFNMDFDESLVWGAGEWGTASWGWIDLIGKQMNVGKKGKRVQITFKNSVVDEPVTIYGVAMLVKAKKAKASKTGVTKV